MRDLIFKLRVLRFMVADVVESWRSAIWEKDPDGLFCCDGRECCCGGGTIRDMWEWTLPGGPK